MVAHPCDTGKPPHRGSFCKEFAFTKLFTCGMCGSGISAKDKYKPLKDGTTAHYIYYGCGRGKDHTCKNPHIREEELIGELIRLIDQISLNELGMRHKLEDEFRRMNKFQRIFWEPSLKKTRQRSK